MASLVQVNRRADASGVTVRPVVTAGLSLGWWPACGDAADEFRGTPFAKLGPVSFGPDGKLYAPR